MPGRATERAGDRVGVRREQFRIDGQILDSGLLGRLPQRRVDDRLVGFLAVPAELDPRASTPAVWAACDNVFMTVSQ